MFFCPGKHRLRELGIAVVYDLRSDTEIEKYDTPCPTIDGVDVVRVPVFKHEDYTPEMMAKCVSSNPPPLTSNDTCACLDPLTPSHHPTGDLSCMRAERPR